MNTISHKLIVVLLAVILLAVAVPCVSNAQTYSHIYVDAVNGVNVATGRGAAAAPYKSITYAFLISNKNNLPDPWHVHIRPGTYNVDPAKPVTEREVFPIRLRSEMIFEGTTNANECIIDAGHLGRRTNIPILLGENASGVHIRNLTIKNMWMGIDGTDVKATNAQIVLIGEGQKPNTLKGCIVHQDEGGERGDRKSYLTRGLWTTIPLVLVENTFSNNNFGCVEARKGVVATDNTFRDNGTTSLRISGDSTGDIIGNFFGTPSWGVNVAIVCTLNGNISDNTFNGGGVQIRSGPSEKIKMNGDVTHNIFSHCRGIYKRSGGGFYVSILNGNLTHNTFTNNVPSRGAPGPRGGGVAIDTLNGNLTYNTFTNNTANGGGGVYVDTLNGNLTHNTFANNTGIVGGGLLVNYMKGDIADNEFTKNTGGGAAVYEKLTGNVTHNIFDSNSVGHHDTSGLLLGWRPQAESEGPVEVSNNIFFNNKINENISDDSMNHFRGVTLTTRMPVRVVNNLFMLTSEELVKGEYKPHIWLSVPESRFHNNIFVGMHFAIHIYGLYDLPITHNIFYNIGRDIVSQAGSSLGNDLAFWELLMESASNNLAVAPRLVDVNSFEKNFHLQAGSPAIDAGTNAYAPDDDFDGAARPVGNAVDIGPYEYGGKKRPDTVPDVPVSETPDVTDTETPTTNVPVSETPDVTETEVSTTDATVNISPASVAATAVGEQIEFSLNITSGEAVAGYQATVQFDTTALRYVSSANGDYLPDGAFFVKPVVEGNLIKLSAASLDGESKGDGTLAKFTFEVIVMKASTLTLSDVLLTDSKGTGYVPNLENAHITEAQLLKGDVNGDGVVDIRDLVLVASNLGKTGQNAADVNTDGIVDIRDLVLVAGALGTTAAAPSLYPQALEILTVAEVKQWLSAAQQLDRIDARSLRGILFLQQLFTALTPKQTALLANYPNPFNPETWIPYKLAKPADVTVHIYAMNGTLIRTLVLGRQPAGMYQNRTRAAYWNGKNEIGEKVASAVYFYTLTAGDFTATRKMLIRK